MKAIICVLIPTLMGLSVIAQESNRARLPHEAPVEVDFLSKTISIDLTSSNYREKRPVDLLLNSSQELTQLFGGHLRQGQVDSAQALLVQHYNAKEGRRHTYPLIKASSFFRDMTDPALGSVVQSALQVQKGLLVPTYDTCLVADTLVDEGMQESPCYQARVYPFRLPENDSLFNQMLYAETDYYGCDYSPAHHRSKVALFYKKGTLQSFIAIDNQYADQRQSIQWVEFLYDEKGVRKIYRTEAIYKIAEEPVLMLLRRMYLF